MAGMALFEPGPIALADDLGWRMAPDLRNPVDAGVRQMVLQQFGGLEAEPCIDHCGGAIGEILDEGEDRLIARLAEQPVVVAIAGAEMLEERFLDGVEGEERPALGLR